MSVNSYMLPQGTRFGSAAMPAADQRRRSGARTAEPGQQQPEPAEQRGPAATALGPPPDASARDGDRRRRRHPTATFAAAAHRDVAAATPTRRGGRAARGSRRRRAAAIAWLLSVSHACVGHDCSSSLGFGPAHCRRAATTSASSARHVAAAGPVEAGHLDQCAVRPSSSRRARTQTRRGRMNSEPSSPSSASTTPAEGDMLAGRLADLDLVPRARRRRSVTDAERRRAARRVSPGLQVDAEQRAVGLGHQRRRRRLVERVDRLRRARRPCRGRRCRPASRAPGCGRRRRPRPGRRPSVKRTSGRTGPRARSGCGSRVGRLDHPERRGTSGSSGRKIVGPL